MRTAPTELNARCSRLGCDAVVRKSECRRDRGLTHPSERFNETMKEGAGVPQRTAPLFSRARTFTKALVGSTKTGSGARTDLEQLRRHRHDLVEGGAAAAGATGGEGGADGFDAAGFAGGAEGELAGGGGRADAHANGVGGAEVDGAAGGAAVIDEDGGEGFEDAGAAPQIAEAALDAEAGVELGAGLEAIARGEGAAGEEIE